MITSFTLSSSAEASAPRSGCMSGRGGTVTSSPPAASAKTRYSMKNGAKATALSPGSSTARQKAARPDEAPIVT